MYSNSVSYYYLYNKRVICCFTTIRTPHYKLGTSRENRTPIIGFGDQGNAIIRARHNWCERWDSNPQTFRRLILSQMRLPITPHSRKLVSMVGFELTTFCSQSRRTTRLCYTEKSINKKNQMGI